MNTITGNPDFKMIKRAKTVKNKDVQQAIREGWRYLYSEFSTEDRCYYAILER